MDLLKIEKAIADAVADKLASLIDREFSRKVNPNDEPWALTVKEGRPFDIRDSIRSSIKVVAKGDTVEIDSSKAYTIFHQTGTSKMVQRKIFPDDKLSKKWKNEIEDAIQIALDKIMTEELRKELIDAE